MSCLDVDLLVYTYRQLAFKDARKRDLTDFRDQPAVSRWLQSADHQGQTPESLLRKAVLECFYARPNLTETCDKIRSALYSGQTLTVVFRQGGTRDDTTTLVASARDIGLACLYLHCFDYRESLATLSQTLGWRQDSPTLKRLVWASVRGAVHEQLYSLLTVPRREVQEYRRKEVRLTAAGPVIHNTVAVRIYDPVFAYQHGIRHNLLEFEGQDRVELVSGRNRHDHATVWAALTPTIRGLMPDFRLERVPGGALRWVLAIRVRWGERVLKAGDLLEYEYELRSPNLFRQDTEHVVQLVAAHNAMQKAVVAIVIDKLSYDLQGGPEFGVSRSADPAYFESFKTLEPVRITGETSEQIVLEASEANVTGAIWVRWTGGFR